ncbi:uncharacterized protein BJX67DRAFT_106955 [Aspergillus lucknowensis]|uniref:Myb-like domain-containing protein n=1 Tax=Aspergillus lucknowensis TaxID=176173 RepID=A0ABR4LRM9_9EURO
MTPDTSRPSSPTNGFVALNSPAGKKLDAVNAVVKQEQDVQNEDAPASIVKTELEEEVKPTISADESADGTTSAAPTPTPRKRGRKPNNTNGDSTVTPTKRPRKDAGVTTSTSMGSGAGTAGGANTGGTPTRATLPSIPTSLEAAGTEDKMILNLRDNEGRSWAEVTKTFVSITGIKVGGSTLRMRYNTMKANFVTLTEEDAARLIRLKKDIEDKFEAEKWARLSEAISQDGGEKYPAAALQKKFKELSKAGGSASAASNTSTIPAGIVEGEDGQNGEHEE